MKFSNLSRQLNNYASQKHIALEDALNLMNMLCDDIRFDSGVPLENCRVQDWDMLVDELYALTYTVNTLYHTNQAAIREAEQTSTEDALWEQMRNAEAECQRVRAKLHQADGIRQQLQQQKNALQECINEENQRQSEVVRYRQDIARMESDLEALRSTDLQPLIERYTALEHEQMEKQSLLRQLRQQADQKEQEVNLLRMDVEKHQAAADAMAQEKFLLQQRLEQLMGGSSQNTQQLALLRQQVQDAENRSGTLNMEYLTLTTQLESQENDNRNFENDKLLPLRASLAQALEEARQMDQVLEEIKRQRETVGTQISQAATFIGIRKQDLDKKTLQLSEQTKELDALNAQISTIDAEFKPLLEEINRRKAYYEGMDKVQIETGLLHDLQELQDKTEELEQKKQQLSDVQQQVAQQDCLLASTRQELEMLSNQKTAKEQSYAALCQDVSQLQTQLAYLGTPECTARLVRQQNQLQILQQIRSNLEQSSRAIGCNWTFQLEQDLNQRMQYTEQTLKELRNAIMDHSQVFQTELHE